MFEVLVDSCEARIALEPFFEFRLAEQAMDFRIRRVEHHKGSLKKLGEGVNPGRRKEALEWCRAEFQEVTVCLFPAFILCQVVVRYVGE